METTGKLKNFLLSIFAIAFLFFIGTIFAMIIRNSQGAERLCIVFFVAACACCVAMVVSVAKNWRHGFICGMFGTCFFLIASFIVFCNIPTKYHEETVANIEQVFMHESGTYSFRIRTSANVTVDSQEYHIFVGKTAEFHDVTEGNLGWAKIYYTGCCSTSGYKMELHLPTPSNIQGAGWNHGKFGEGQTVVVK